SEMKGALTVQGWRRELASLTPRVAYERVIMEDRLDGYEAFVLLFADSPYGQRVRDLLVRRREMMAWNIALTINTPAAYQAFLTDTPSSVLAATARKRMDRVRTRPQIASLDRAPIAAAVSLPAGPLTGAGPAAPTGPAGPSGGPAQGAGSNLGGFT